MSENKLKKLKKGFYRDVEHNVVDLIIPEALSETDELVVVHTTFGCTAFVEKKDAFVVRYTYVELPNKELPIGEKAKEAIDNFFAESSELPRDYLIRRLKSGASLKDIGLSLSTNERIVKSLVILYALEKEFVEAKKQQQERQRDWKIDKYDPKYRKQT